MCNFLNFSYGSQFEKRHKVAKKAHDHAGNTAHWVRVRVKPTCVFLITQIRLYLSVLCFSD